MQKKGMNVPKVNEPNADDFAGALPQEVVNAPESENQPPPIEKVVEAMFFVGGQPLTSKRACEILRGLDFKDFVAIIAGLNKKYKLENRPYRIQPKGNGYEMAILPKYRIIADKLYGMLKEARLSAQALDTLALVAYKQPVCRQEIETLRGNDTAAIIRQLVRLGLISVQRGQSDAREITYGTTKKFLELFRLKSLEDLPRHQEMEEL
ncbi:MAG: SMC-Scp complex subunit ScpB [Gemmataceae bacterium]|nr:SMC-Scp complex subunit ScpB [Gemmataceae bacterium]MBJ7495159.1 SMC-Scp complex subunit ScpB [Gemmataceae bacterium]